MGLRVGLTHWPVAYQSIGPAGPTLTMLLMPGMGSFDHDHSPLSRRR